MDSGFQHCPPHQHKRRARSNHCEPTPQDFEVRITSYEICLVKQSSFQKFSFEYIAIDEAHRIKNTDSIPSQIIDSFISRGRLLITGAPSQWISNARTYLWIMRIWRKRRRGRRLLKLEALHNILRPFLLSRVMTDGEKNLFPSSRFSLFQF